MSLINSLNKHIDISLYYPVVDDTVYKDPKLIELLRLVEENPNRYIYALYGDNNFLKTNIYLPIFHTTYLSCKKHNVLMNTVDDAWLLDIFPNNEYYLIAQHNQSIPQKVKIINSIQDII